MISASSSVISQALSVEWAVTVCYACLQWSTTCQLALCQLWYTTIYLAL